jgi:hypothetical protein
MLAECSLLGNNRWIGEEPCQETLMYVARLWNRVVDMLGLRNNEGFVVCRYVWIREGSLYNELSPRLGASVALVPANTPGVQKPVEYLMYGNPY